ncbi:hypothetical protein C8R44DRAFT_786823, partial [Mycena epipterygia]
MPDHSDKKTVGDSDSDTHDSISDSDRIAKLQQFIKEADPGNLKLPEWHLDLGKAFSRKYRKSSKLEDLQGALLNLQHSVNFTPQAHPERAGRLGNLADCLRKHYCRSKNLEDLEKALQN